MAYIHSRFHGNPTAPTGVQRSVSPPRVRASERASAPGDSGGEGGPVAHGAGAAAAVKSEVQ